MATYNEQLEQLAAQLKRARAALASDLAEAVGRKDWGAKLRDKADVEALVATIDERLQDASFVSQVHAAADKARQLVRGPGRPPKPKGRVAAGPDKAKVASATSGAGAAN